MARLADEMRNILKVNRMSTLTPVSGPYTSSSSSNSYEDDYVYGNTLTVLVIDDLRSIAERMNRAGYLQDCKKAYISERKNSIDVSYKCLGVNPLSTNEAQTMEWKYLEPIIGVWIKSARICFRKIFTYEKQLCKKIFQGLGRDSEDACFLETVNHYAVRLLDIGKTLSCIRKASERLFGILDLYKTLSGLLPEIKEVFNTLSSESLRSKADGILVDLGGAASKTLSGFEKDVLTAHLPVHKIHGLSKYVMDYVSKLCQNKQALMELSLSKPPSISGAGMNLMVGNSQQPNELPYHVVWIITCLVFKLEGEAGSSKSGSARHFFLMNNIYFVVQEIDRKPKVKEMVGDDCFRRLSGKFERAKDVYLGLTFAKVLSCLGEEGSKSNKTSLSKRLNNFNSEFQKLQGDLEALSVPHFQLLQELRASMETMLVPAYTAFVRHLSSAPSLTKDVKFSVAQLKDAILAFFTKRNPK